MCEQREAKEKHLQISALSYVKRKMGFFIFYFLFFIFYFFELLNRLLGF
jgi:hypothetical protein